MTPNPSSKGKEAEAAVLAALVRAGKSVLLPWGEERFDLVIYEGDTFRRVQVKHGQLKNGYVLFRTCSVNRDGGQPNYQGQIELFAVYCSELDTVYLVPIELVGRRMASLRVSPTLSNQQSGVRWARDYELATVEGA